MNMKRQGFAFVFAIFLAVGVGQIMRNGIAGPATAALSLAILGFGVVGLLGSIVSTYLERPWVGHFVTLGVSVISFPVLLVVGYVAANAVGIVGANGGQQAEANVPLETPKPRRADGPPPPPPLARPQNSPPPPPKWIEPTPSSMAATPAASTKVPRSRVAQKSKLTEMVGAAGGEEYEYTDLRARPVIGFRYGLITLLTPQGEQEVLQTFDPIHRRTDRYAQLNSANPKNGAAVAREGYAVGGIEVAAASAVNAVRIIFVRATDGKIDKNDSYTSDWFGSPAGKSPKNIGMGITHVLGVKMRSHGYIFALGLLMDDEASPQALTSEPGAPTQPATVPAATPAVTKPTEKTAKPTDLVGGKGGIDFQTVDPQRRLVIGFRARLGFWTGEMGREEVIGEFEPLFDRETDTTRHPTNAQNPAPVVARDGYVVGGIQVAGESFVNAVRVIFVRETEGKLDKSDFYMSQWIGKPDSRKQKTLGTGTTRVVGICGRRAAVLDSVGLLLEE